MMFVVAFAVVNGADAVDASAADFVAEISWLVAVALPLTAVFALGLD